MWYRKIHTPVPKPKRKSLSEYTVGEESSGGRGEYHRIGYNFPNVGIIIAKRPMHHRKAKVCCTIRCLLSSRGIGRLASALLLSESIIPQSYVSLIAAI